MTLVRQKERISETEIARSATGASPRQVFIDVGTSKPSLRPDLVYDASFVVSLKALVPIGALLMTALIIGLLAWLIYSVPTEATRSVSIATGAGIVLVTAVVSRGRAFPRGVFRRVALLAVYPLLLAAVFVAIILPAESRSDKSATRSAPGAEIFLKAANLSFTTKTIEITAGGRTTVQFVNDDTAPHNLAIYKTPKADEVLFQGATIEGGGSVDYVIEGLRPGKYYFRCDVHPAMDGAVIVS